MERLKVRDKYFYYNCLGSGSEGNVYSYNGKYAIKVFPDYIWTHNGLTLKKRKRKMQKVEAMMSLRDPSAAFPLGFAKVPGREPAYYMEEVRRTNRNHPKDLVDCLHEKYDDKTEEILVKADAALQRIHKLGVAVGDIKENNILLRDGREPVYVDLDNAIYQGFMYDLIPDRAGCLFKIYGGSAIAHQDNDILLFALMALHMKTKDDRFSFRECKLSIAEGLHQLKKDDKETKEILKCIFSDAENKPYIGKVLHKIH
ncbi:MAG: serine/threonine protein kinase [Bacilli bacterium]|nr:serine/threonine protein kinase [Bacilli bacterium]